MVWLLCDYGEVLSVPQPPEDKAVLQAAAGWDGPGDFWDVYWHHRPAYDRGDVSVAEYWEAVLGHPPSADRLERLIRVDVAGWLHPNPESLDAVHRLKAAKGAALGLAILSNAPIEVAEGIEGAPWLALFTDKFFSCWLRSVKPEPAAYQAVVDALGVEPEEIVFVDDRPANVAAAAGMGLQAEWFEGPALFDRLAPNLSER